MFNGFDCNITINAPNLTDNSLSSLETLDVQYSPVSNNISFPIVFKVDPSCSSKLTAFNLTSTVTVVEGKVGMVLKMAYNLIYNLYRCI